MARIERDIRFRFHQLPLASHLDQLSDSAARALLPDLIRSDSLTTEWALADLAADPWSSDQSEANIAADTYRILFGSAGPILDRLESIWPTDRRATGLRAIRMPLSDNEEQLVFGYACGALWILDQVLRAHFEGSRESVLLSTTPYDEMTIVEAYDLLSPARRSQLAPSIARIARARGGFLASSFSSLLTLHQGDR